MDKATDFLNWTIERDREAAHRAFIEVILPWRESGYSWASLIHSMGAETDRDLANRSLALINGVSTVDRPKAPTPFSSPRHTAQREERQSLPPFTPTAAPTISLTPDMCMKALYRRTNAKL